MHYLLGDLLTGGRLGPGGGRPTGEGIRDPGVGRKARNCQDLEQRGQTNRLRPRFQRPECPSLNGIRVQG